MMKLLPFVIATLLLTLSASCTRPRLKLVPGYRGVDNHVQRLVDEYMWLSMQNNIHFYGQVSIGFTNINEGNIIGYCTRGPMFREIDLDISNWNSSTVTTQMSLLFHELNHCYCRRNHDYAEGKEYPASYGARVGEALEWAVYGGPRPGYLEDGCPASLMHPVVMDDDCMKNHYSDYTRELFQRCKPW